MSAESVLQIARAGRAAGCNEALLTLGEKPELRYSAAADWLKAAGYASTIDYLAHVAQLILRETGLLPHINAGALNEEEFTQLRPVSASMGFMLETASERLSARGMPHYGSPDKHPRVRLAALQALVGRVDVHAVGAVQVLDHDRPLADAEASMHPRDQALVYHHVALRQPPDED